MPGPSGGRISSILFLCGMNSIRSPMAEAIAKAALPSTVYIASAGVRAGERDPFVDSVLSEHGARNSMTISKTIIST